VISNKTTVEYEQTIYGANSLEATDLRTPKDIYQDLRHSKL